MPVLSIPQTRAPKKVEPAKVRVKATPKPAFEPYRHWYLPCKHVIDMVLAATMLVLACPIILAAAAVMKLTSRGPAFYSQIRLGRYGRHFTVYKLRTMIQDAERLTGPKWSTPGDPRITLVGRFLRKTHIDELPQLWNVLRGEMSLIGPRPERPEFLPALQKQVPHYRDRLLVRPGITGLAQVRLPADTDMDSVRRKLANDLCYIHQMGPWLDFKIGVCTAFKVLHVPLSYTRRLLYMPHVDAKERMHVGLATES